MRNTVNNLLDILENNLLEYSYLLEYKTEFLIGIGVMIFLSVLIIILCNTRDFIEVTEEIKIKTDKGYTKRTLSRYLNDYIPCKLSKKLDELYKYSRLYKNAKVIKTSFQYWLASFCICFGALFIALFLTKKIVMSVVLAFIVFLAGCVGNVYLRVYFNNKAVDKDLMAFINLLGNYSTGNNEITSLFVQIAPKMHEPLRSCLLECVSESQNTEKSKNVSLRNLSNKISHPKFREIIKNIEISSSYISNFGVIAEQSRVSAFNYSKGKRQLHELIQENFIVMAIVIGILVGMLSFVGQIVEDNIYSQLFTTTVGNLVMYIAIGCIFVFVKKLLDISKA